jgi:hypothetical protein
MNNESQNTEKLVVQDEETHHHEKYDYENNNDKPKIIGIRYFLLFMLNGFLNVIITVLQIIYTSKTRNFIYFFGCSMFGPFHITAVMLAVSISIIRI